MSLIKEYRGFNIENDDTFSMKHIKYKGEGSVPMSLRGAYTKASLAEQDIDMFLEAATEGKKNAKTNSSSGSE